MRRIRWGHFVVGIVILTITLLLAVYVPTPPVSIGGGRRMGNSLAALVSIFGEFAGRYYFFLLPLLFGLYELREAFREPRMSKAKP
jgi:hypothetical protein